MEPNPYQSPEQTGNSNVKPPDNVVVKTTTMFCWHLSFVIVMSLILIFVIPRFDRMFMEFEIKLPASTSLALTISRLTVSYWYLLILIAPIYFLFLYALNANEQRFTWLRLLWPSLFWFGGALFFVFLCFSMFAPLLGLMDNLSK